MYKNIENTCIYFIACSDHPLYVTVYFLATSIDFCVLCVINTSVNKFFSPIEHFLCYNCDLAWRSNKTIAISQ